MNEEEKAIVSLSRNLGSSSRGIESYKLACHGLGISLSPTDNNFAKMYDLVRSKMKDILQRDMHGQEGEIQERARKECVSFTCGILRIAGFNNHSLCQFANDLDMYDVKLKYPKVDLILTMYEFLCNLPDEDFNAVQNVLCCNRGVACDQYTTAVSLVELCINEGIITDSRDISPYICDLAKCYNRYYFFESYLQRHMTIVQVEMRLNDQSNNASSAVSQAVSQAIDQSETSSTLYGIAGEQDTGQDSNDQELVIPGGGGGGRRDAATSTSGNTQQTVNVSILLLSLKASSAKSQWYRIGEELKIPPQELNNLQAKQRSDDYCIEEVVHMWKDCPEYTWDHLLQVLEKLGLHDTIQKISENLSSEA